jgi:hypothetical protein
MRLALRTAAPVALCLVLARLLVAQVDHAHNAEQLGRVVAFPTSRRPQVQAAFERALALSHSFWWEAGPPAFRAVAAADSECAMAYWGLALNGWGNPFTSGPSGDALREGAAAAERGLAIGARTARERGFGAIGP